MPSWDTDTYTDDDGCEVTEYNVDGIRTDCGDHSSWVNAIDTGRSWDWYTDADGCRVTDYTNGDPDVECFPCTHIFTDADNPNESYQEPWDFVDGRDCVVRNYAEGRSQESCDWGDRALYSGAWTYPDGHPDGPSYTWHTEPWTSTGCQERDYSDGRVETHCD